MFQFVKSAWRWALDKANKLLDVALCLIRKWWRPIVCISMGLALLVNGVVMPIWTRTPADMVGLAALCASLAPFAWLRTREKAQGIVSQDSPLP